MSDLYLGVLLVIGAMTLIFFGPELGRLASRKVIRSRRRMRHTRRTYRRNLKVRTRKTIIIGHFAHS
jgi:hypothetical protein